MPTSWVLPVETPPVARTERSIHSRRSTAPGSSRLGAAAFVVDPRAPAVATYGVSLRASDVSFGGTAFAPTRVTVRVRGEVRVQLGAGERAGGEPLVGTVPAARPPSSYQTRAALVCRVMRAVAAMTARSRLGKES